MENKDKRSIESTKEKMDKLFPQTKMLREIELKRTAHNLFNKSAIGKVSSIIYMIIAVCSIFVYWKLLGINIFVSIILGIITWFVMTYILDKILIKLSGIERALIKINDEEIETAAKELEKTGISIDDLSK